MNRFASFAIALLASFLAVYVTGERLVGVAIFVLVLLFLRYTK